MLTRLAGLGVAAVLLATTLTASAADLLIRGARLLDGTGAPPRPDVTILVRDGRIAAIGREVEAPDVPVLDVAGATVIPGLVDAHVHLSVNPGAGQRDDSVAVTTALRRWHLRAYLACGVTTVLDTSIPPEVAREIQGWIAAGEPAPRFLSLGPGFVAPGGYLANALPAAATPAEVEAQLDQIEALAAVGVKVFVERGFGASTVWPIPSPAIREAIVRGAARRGLPIYVHANREDDKNVALDMRAHAIVHAGFYTGGPSDAFVARMAASGAYLMTTFGIMDSTLARFHPERLDDEVVRRVVPPLELATARNPDAGLLLAATELGMAAPWLPTSLRPFVARLTADEPSIVERLHNSQRAVHRLWEAGVPIVAGSDAGNWPIVPYQFHGPTALREVELLAAAGLPPAEALAAAGRNPARMLGLEHEIGTVEVGKRADLVVLRKDPLRSVRNLRTVRWTIRDGVARSSAGWLSDLPPPP